MSPTGADFVDPGGEVNDDFSGGGGRDGMVALRTDWSAGSAGAGEDEAVAVGGEVGG